MNKLKLLFVLLFIHSCTYSQKIEQYIFKLRPQMCSCDETSKNRARTLVGFKVRDSIGIFTALHGVADCKYVDIIDNDDKVYKYFELAYVDIKNDIAYLKPSSAADISRKSEKAFYQKKYESRGLRLYYLDTIDGTKSAIIRYYASNTKFIPKHVNILRADTFSNFIKPKFHNPNYDALMTSFLIYNDRGSPNLLTVIAIIDEIVAHGNSGAPIVQVLENKKRKILTDQVFGMLDGGFEDDKLSWCIPLGNVNLVSANSRRNSLKKINSKCPPSGLFSYENPIEENKLYKTNELDRALRIIANKSFTNQDLIDMIFKVHNKENFKEEYPVSYYYTMAFAHWYGMDGGKSHAKEYLNKLFQYTDSVMSSPDKELLRKNNIHQYDFLALKREIYNYELYKNLINQAAAYFQEGNYHEALGKYLKAHSVREQGKEAAQKIVSTRKIISTRYNENLTQADKFYKYGKLDSALTYYKKALYYKPKEKYPTNQINEIVKRKKDLKDQVNYDEYISNGEKIFEIFDNAFKSNQELYYYLPSIQYSADFVGTNGSDLSITYQYGVSETSIKDKESLFIEMSKNNFPLGQYNYEGAYLAIKILKDALQSIMDSTNMNISRSNSRVTILGTADGVQFKKPIQYRDDFGKINFANFGIGDNENNKKLALLRAYFAKRELMTLRIFSEKNTALRIKEYPDNIGGEYRKVIITIRINGARNIMYDIQSNEVKEKIQKYYQDK